MSKSGHKTPAAILLLRKSRRGDKVPVLKESDFPLRFQTEDGRAYIIERTRKGGTIMKAEKALAPSQPSE